MAASMVAAGVEYGASTTARSLRGCVEIRVIQQSSTQLETFQLTAAAAKVATSAKTEVTVWRYTILEDTGKDEAELRAAEGEGGRGG